MNDEKEVLAGGDEDLAEETKQEDTAVAEELAEPEPEPGDLEAEPIVSDDDDDEEKEEGEDE